MNNFISDEDIEKAVLYLTESAKPYAEWKANMKWLEQKRKTVRSTVALKQNAKSNTESLTRAEASTEYSDILGEYKDSVYHFALIESYRKAAELKIEIWRSLNANNRKGNIQTYSCNPFMIREMGSFTAKVEHVSKTGTRNNNCASINIPKLLPTGLRDVSSGECSRREYLGFRNKDNRDSDKIPRPGNFRAKLDPNNVYKFRTL